MRQRKRIGRPFIERLAALVSLGMLAFSDGRAGTFTNTFAHREAVNLLNA